MIKLIGMDFDGTLLNDSKEVKKIIDKNYGGAPRSGAEKIFRAVM